MDVLFLSCAYSETQKDIFMLRSKRGYQFAAQNLQEALIDGFLDNDINLSVLTIPALSTYPMGCKLLKINDEPFVYRNNKYGYSIGYYNLPFAKESYSISKKALTRVEEWYNKSGSEKVVFVYALIDLQMSLAVAIKNEYPDVKLTIIVPDLPRFMGCNWILKKLGFQEKYCQKIKKLLHNFDGFVVLAEPMIQDLKVENKPFVVVEGIYSGVKDKESIPKSDNKVILYTGNIGTRYGIKYLIDAFEQIHDTNYRLQIRGSGDKTEILSLMEKDNRVEYIGPLSKQELNRLQKRATVLVNPVPPDQEFTRFFFPSKTMDYLASGTPIVMFKLDCMPREYYDYMFFFEDKSASSMSKTLIDICERDQQELDRFGEKATDFVLSHKNPKIQVGKIKSLFEELFKNESCNS